MLTQAVSKFGFRIRTRNGVVVENLSIFGRDEADAQSRLSQMYPHCVILERQNLPAQQPGRAGHASYEDVMDLITSGNHRLA